MRGKIKPQINKLREFNINVESELNSPKFEAKLAYIFQSSGRGEGELSHYIIRKQFAYKYCIRGMAEVAASSQISARKSDEESDTINNLSIDDSPRVK